MQLDYLTAFQTGDFEDVIAKEMKRSVLIVILTAFIHTKCDAVRVTATAGGFVNSSCSNCRADANLSEVDFFSLNLWVSCPKCRMPMNPDYIVKNYGFVCRPCDLGIELATLLPRWTDA